VVLRVPGAQAVDRGEHELAACECDFGFSS
jgi:hypothetical protein